MDLAVDGALDEMLVAIFRAREEMGRALEGVMDAAQDVAAGGPGEEGLTGDVGQEAGLTGVGADAVKRSGEEVEGLGDDADAAGVGDGAPVGLDVELDAGLVLSGGAVVGDGQEDATQGIEVRDAGGARVRERQGGAALFGGGARLFAGEPEGAGDGVVLVPGLLLPGVEDDAGGGVVGLISADNAGSRPTRRARPRLRSRGSRRRRARTS
jgi:hypothetical protein